MDMLFMSKESSFFEKRVLMRFLKASLTQSEYTPLEYEDL
jgi:hypothetical protein